MGTYLAVTRPGYFNPRSPCGERPEKPCVIVIQDDFNPRSPCGERLTGPQGLLFAHPHFNPRSPCGERRGLIGKATELTLISIHALLAESDLLHSHGDGIKLDFNPRSPCGERPMVFRCSMGRASFQSTLSLRRATMELCLAGEVMWISIHALLAESDS